jgi:hypothetical protein
MSAFIVDPEHINVMLWAGAQHAGHHGPLRWYFGNPTHIGELHDDNLDQIGQMLLDENAASVNYRYSENNHYEYRYRRPRHISWSVPELLNVVHCYEYQACEHPEWEHSQAHAFCAALQQRLITKLPGYSDGPWAITDTTAPAAVRKAKQRTP